MMKKHYFQKTFAAALAALGLLAGCFNILGPRDADDAAPQSGLVRINLNTGDATAGENALPALSASAPASRTILPSAPSNYYYTLAFTSAGKPPVTEYLDQAVSKDVGLAAGTWALVVTGYADSLRTEQVLSGAADLNVSAGGSGSVTVYLMPAALLTGTGTLAWDIQFPDSVSAGTLTIKTYPADTVVKTVDLLGTANGNNHTTENSVTTAAGSDTAFAAGYYRALVNLSDGTSSAAFTDIAHVYKDAVTTVTKTFTTANFALIPDDGLRYVKFGGAGDGKSWNTASGDLQAMIDQAYAAKLATPSIQPVVRVAAGTYKPIYKPNSDGTRDTSTTPGDRDSTFILRPGVEIRGGYPSSADNNTAEASRDWTSNPTTLSGDIDNVPDGGNAMSGFSGMDGNVYHVVIGVDIPNDGNTILDGFTIRGGNADGSGSITVDGQLFGKSNGAGMYNYYSSPVLTNITISGNSAYSDGGSMYNYSSSPVLTNVTISGNSTTAVSGGGMFNDYYSSPILTNVTISGNSAGSGGGGMFNDDYSSPVLINVTISGNSAGGGGGMYNYNSSPVLTNVTISGNSSAGSGGGMGNVSGSSAVLTNVTISGNVAINNSGGMLNTGSSSLTLRNSIIWGNITGGTGPGIYYDSGTVAVTYSIVQGGWTGAGGNNSSTNPVFVTDVPSSPMPNTGGNLHLQNTSPAINAGNNADYPDTWLKWNSLINTPNPSVIDTEAKYNAYVKDALTKDAGGAARFRPWGGVIDMGAYEEPNGNSTPLSAASDAAFTAALTAVQSSNGTHFTITLSGDISLSPQTLSGPGYANKTIVLTSDATDRTITLASAGSLFTVGEDVRLVVEDITLEGISNNNVPLLKVESGGTLTVNTGGVITGNTNAISTSQANAGGGVYVEAGASFILDGGTISDNTVSCPRNAAGGGVHVLGTFTMYGGSIVGNRATNTAGAYGAGGAGVWVDGNGTFTMIDGTISENIAHCTGYASGGGVYVTNPPAHFTMQGGSITNNTVSSSSSSYNQLGGGLFYPGNTFTQTGGSITGNWSIKGNQTPEANDIYHWN
jgi:hypothetical protein